MTQNETKELVEATKATGLLPLQKQMIWEAANYQIVTEQFARLAQATQTLLKFFHGVGRDVEKAWKNDPTRAKLLASAQKAYDEAKLALGPVAMIKPADIFGETEVVDGQPASQDEDATCCQEHGAEETHKCGCQA